MAKEVLRLGGPLVVVDYDFRNDSDQDVTTEVAFPVPAYENEYPEGASTDVLAFRSFKLWVNEKPVDYQMQAKATLKDKDVTAELEASHIDIATLGHLEEVTDAASVTHQIARDYNHLPKPAREKLVHEGLFEPMDRSAIPKWTVHLQYHWTQTFPRHATMHIRHEYKPVVGSQNMSLGDVQAFAKGKPDAPLDKDSEEFYSRKILSSFCLDDPTLRAMTGRFHSSSDSQDKTDADAQENYFLAPQWIDFILTTANTWKQPIEDFTLIIERPKASEGQQELISFCTPGKVEKMDAEHFRVHLSGFVPKGELHIGFFGVPSAKASHIRQRNK